MASPVETAHQKSGHEMFLLTQEKNNMELKEVAQQY